LGFRQREPNPTRPECNSIWEAADNDNSFLWEEDKYLDYAAMEYLSLAELANILGVDQE
jgi:hypothetical protein